MALESREMQGRLPASRLSVEACAPRKEQLGYRQMSIQD